MMLSPSRGRTMRMYSRACRRRAATSECAPSLPRKARACRCARGSAPFCFRTPGRGVTAQVARVAPLHMLLHAWRRSVGGRPAPMVSPPWWAHSTRLVHNVARVECEQHNVIYQKTITSADTFPSAFPSRSARTEDNGHAPVHLITKAALNGTKITAVPACYHGNNVEQNCTNLQQRP